MAIVSQRSRPGSSPIGGVCTSTLLLQRSASLVSFWLGYLRGMEKFLQDQVHHSLANFGVDALEFIPHPFGILQVHDIKGNLIAYAFSNDRWAIPTAIRSSLIFSPINQGFRVGVGVL